MILRALYDLHERLSRDPRYLIAPPGFSYQRVTFVVVLEKDGVLVDIADARQDRGGQPVARRVLVPGGAKPSGSGLNPCFLWDNSKYALGCDLDVDVAKRNPERARRAFEAFRERHLGLRDEVASQAFDSVCAFLESWSPAKAVDFPVLAELSQGFGVFQIRGETRYVHQVEEIANWWKTVQGSLRAEEGISAPCLVTGEEAPIARLHPKIKGVRGAQPGGASLVGFNDDAYVSYGKSQSFNAPVSVEATHRYTSALNALLDGPEKDRHVLVIGGMTAVFWTAEPSPVEDVFAQFHSGALVEVKGAQDDATRARIAAFLKALRMGREAYGDLDDHPDRSGYCILGLGPNAARISVRFFQQSSISELLDNLRRHFADIAIERYRERDPEFPPAWRLLSESAREAKEIPPTLAAPLLAAIIEATPYPMALFQAVVRRIRADRVIDYLRACVLKGYLVRNLGKEIPMALDPSRKAPEYRLGRLFAALEKTQKDALGEGLNATIRDRFYAAASATPGAVFPRLLRTYQHHLAKLDGGRKVNREKLVQEIFEDLEEIPTHLAIAGQGEFALGYYHQMSDFYRRKVTSADEKGNEA